MSPTFDQRYDAGTAISQGGRERQEDAVLVDFPAGEDAGIGILADGMGGHHGGDIASAQVLTTAFTELRLRRPSIAAAQTSPPKALAAAVEKANRALLRQVSADPRKNGMGATLVATFFHGPHLYWASVGDSLLYVLRDGTLQRLNEDHSLAGKGPELVAAGVIKGYDPENASSILTSSLTGKHIRFIDCPTAPFALKAGDVLIAASDGLETIDADALKQALLVHRGESGATIARRVVKEVLKAGDPDQDNVSVAVVKVLSDAPLPQASRPAQDGGQDRKRLLETGEARKTRLLGQRQPSVQAECPPAIGRLRAAVDAGTLPEDRLEAARRCLERFDARAQIAVLGLDPSRCAALSNFIASAAILPDQPTRHPVVLKHGRKTVVTEGSEVTAIGADLAGIVAHAGGPLVVETPASALSKLTLTHFGYDELSVLDDYLTATHSSFDAIFWCSRNYAADEEDLLASLPEAMADHVHLVLPEGVDLGPALTINTLNVDIEAASALRSAADGLNIDEFVACGGYGLIDAVKREIDMFRRRMIDEADYVLIAQELSTARGARSGPIARSA
jgi:serine/threonine protein phosphatase PrpC